MKKLIALLLVICMVAGLFVGCKKKTQTPSTDPTATESTGATEAVDATENTGDAEGDEATEATEADGETSATKSNKPTAASRVTKATKAPSTKATKTTKATQAAATKATTSTKATTAANIKSPYKGKTIEIYGLGTNDSTYYNNFDNMIKNESTKIYPFIERAAVEEWAALNGVTLNFKGEYDQNTVLAAINAGDTPDVIFQSNAYPGISNNGITAAFTNAEYKKLAEICGEEYLDMLKYGTKSHGVVRPWVGTIMCYYNATMFEDYGVTTPKEYFLKGNWNWDTFLEVMVKMTQDTDSKDGMDTYGLNGDSWLFLCDPLKTNNKGELLSIVDEPYFYDYCKLKYTAYSVKKCTTAGPNRIQTNVIKPLFAMQLSDCEPYNWQHLYQDIPNGNRLEVVPVPEWKGANGETLGTSMLTQSCFHMAASCNEREAVIDMFAYLLKCGLKYVSDYSLGTVDCEFEGLQGSCEYSKKCLEALAKINATRTKKLKALGSIYDASYVTKINNYLEERGHFLYYHSDDIPRLFSYSDIAQSAPETSIPAIKQKYQNALNAYNSTFLK